MSDGDLISDIYEVRNSRLKIPLMRLTIKDLAYNEELNLSKAAKLQFFFCPLTTLIIVLLQYPRWTQRVSLILLYTRESFL
jgi:hypothetical protein